MSLYNDGEKVRSTVTTGAQSSEGDEIFLEKNDKTNGKAQVSTTTTALLQGNDARVADESASRKPDQNLSAAIWAIVWGVALPCIPVIVVSAFLLWLVLSKRILPNKGLEELRLPIDHDHCSGFTDCISFARHNAGHAYFVDANPSTITTIASWTSRVIPYLHSSIMALVAFFAARKIVTKSREGSGEDLPSPEQLTLLIDLLGGKGIEPLKDTMVHRWAHKKKLVEPIPLAFTALFTLLLLGMIIPMADTWFGIATVPASITQILAIDEYRQRQGASPSDLEVDATSTDPAYMSTRALNDSLCPNGPGGFTIDSDTEWMSCNIDWQDDNTKFLRGADDVARILQNSQPASSNISSYPANYTVGNVLSLSDGPAYYYLNNPVSHKSLDYKAKTIAISTQCAPITSQCLPDDTWPVASESVFRCSPGFQGNFSFYGLAQSLDRALSEENEGWNTDSLDPNIGIAFSKDAQLSKQVGAYDPSLWEDEVSSNKTDSGYGWLYPQNPLHFAAWAQGYPYVNGRNVSMADLDPLLQDPQVYRYDGSLGLWVLNCSATVYEVTYTFVNGSIKDFNKTLASPDMAGLISAPFSLFTTGDNSLGLAMSSIAAAATASKDSTTLANIFADRWSQAALALSAGAMEARPNLLNQVRVTEGPLARVPVIPFYVLLLLKAIYVVAVMLLAIGAYCFTHPAETEVVKTQLSTKGLAAAHFETPDILQTKVVSQLSERLQLVKSDEVEIDPAKGGLKRAATFLGDMPDKKIGVVSRADGAWRFAVVANGVWNGIAPIAVDIVSAEARGGGLGDTGGLIQAWIR